MYLLSPMTPILLPAMKLSSSHLRRHGAATYAAIYAVEAQSLFPAPACNQTLHAEPGKTVAEGRQVRRHCFQSRPKVRFLTS
jgi:hypothetical protein